MQYIKDQIKHAIENQDELIEMFAAEPEGKLVERLNIIHLQSVICEKNNDIVTGEFFEIMRSIIIQARIYKWDNNIPDELNELSETLAEMDLAQKKHEERNKLFKKQEKNKRAIEPEAYPETSDIEQRRDSNIQFDLF